jgi:uncharacterized protein DUF4232
VPWLALAPGHRYLNAPLGSPVPPIPVPAGTPVCQAPQLEGASLGVAAATGNVNMPILLRNRGASDCYLEGFPDATVLAPTGKVLAQGSGVDGRGTFFGDGPAVQVMLKAGTAGLPTPGPGYTPPLGQAFLNFSWYDCKPYQANRLALDLPGGGGRLIVPFAMQAYYNAACDNGQPQVASVFRGPISPTGIEWPPGPDYIKVGISISVPASVKRGSTLVYYVTITDEDSRDYVVAPCPDYLELLNQKDPVASYQLNCGPRRTIDAGQQVTFQMRMNIPSSANAGSNTLRWALQDGRIDNSFADAPITLT